MRSSPGRRILGLCAVALSAVIVLSVAAHATVRSEALYAHGLVPFDNGQWEQAYRLFDQAVQADRRDALALYYRGLTQARRGQRAAAIQDMEQAVKLKPTLSHAALDLGIAYFDAGQYEPAKTWLERAHQQGVERLTTAFFLGLTLYRLGDDAGASTYLNEAKADPELRPTAQYYAGLALLRQGKPDLARTELTQTAHDKPQSEVGVAAQRYTATEVGRPPVPGAAARKPWSAYGQLGFEYDTNVVLAPTDSLTKSVVGISRESDGRTVLAAGGSYTFLDTDIGSLRGSYDFYQSIHFNLTQFDLQGHQLRLDAASKAGPVSYGLSGAYDFYALDYQTFYQEVLGTPWVAFAEGTAAATQGYYTVRGRDFFREPYDPARDALNNALGVRQYLALGSPDRLLSIGYQFDSEDTLAHRSGGRPVICTPSVQTGGCGARDFEYNGNQFDIGVAFPLIESTDAQLGYLFRLDDYQFLNSRADFQFRRHDSTHQFVLAVRRELMPQVDAGLSYVGVINNSNIANFEYDRNIVSANVRLKF